MKLRTIIWSAVLVCCIVLGVWQRHNLSIFWHEYHSLWRDYDYQEYHLVLHKTIIPENIARSDPEAAAVADMKLRDYEKDEYITILAENLLKFPENEFFLFLCVNEIFRSNELDQEIGVKLTEKLIDLDKDNSLYHYLRAAAMLANRRGDNITAALEEINITANCPNFYFPDAKYTKQVVAVAERASLPPTLVGRLTNPYLYAPGAYETHKTLLRYAHRAFTDGETEKGLLIDDAINSIGKNQLEAGHYEARLLMNRKNHYLSFIFGYWSCPEILELQRANITKQQARQNRLRLCPYALQQIKNEKTTGRADLDFYRKPEVTDEQMFFTAPIALFNGRMLFATAGVWLALVVICMVRGWSGNQRTGFGALLLFAAASLCYFFVVSGWFFIPFLEICCCCYSYIDIMRPTPLGWEKILNLPPIYLFSLLICPILTALLLWSASRPGLRKMSFWLKIPLRLILTIVVSAIAATLLGVLGHFAHEWTDLPRLFTVFIFVSIFALPVTLFASRLSKLRLVRAVLATMPLGALTVLASPYAYVSQIPMILFVVICTLIVLNKPSAPIPFRKALTGIFSRQPESAAIRSRAIKLLAPFIVIHWLFLAASVPICAHYINYRYSYNFSDSSQLASDATSYKQILARFDSNDFTLSEFYRLAPLVMPQDLPSVLNTTKNRSFTYPNPHRFLKNPDEHSDVNSTPKQDQLIKKLNDGNIIITMQGCGRDVVNILADAMENPEREFALVSRAQLGDTSVKTKLEQLLALRLQGSQPPEPNEHRSHWEKPAEPIDIICALACISEPNEAGARFLDYVARSDISQLAESHKFFEGVRLLQTTQAREVIKAYLVKAQDLQPARRIIFSPAREVVGTYADRDIAEAVLRIMLRSEDNDIIEFWGDPWEIPQDFDIQSADLLRQCLTSKNEPLRAWCVWQLRKVGYQFSEEEMSRLLADESWKVRANAVVAGGPKTAGTAAKDPNPFVRWVASLSDGGEN